MESVIIPSAVVVGALVFSYLILVMVGPKKVTDETDIIQLLEFAKAQRRHVTVHLRRGKKLKESEKQEVWRMDRNLRGCLVEYVDNVNHGDEVFICEAAFSWDDPDRLFRQYSGSITIKNIEWVRLAWFED